MDEAEILQPTANPADIPNDGALIEDIPAGAVNSYSVVLPSGDWSPYAPNGETQRSNRVDTMACVSYSAIHCIETQYFQATGKRIDLSERFLAKMSGTTTAGNYLTKVAAAIQQYGLVLEKDWPSELPNFTWDEYYAEIPQAVKDKAIRFDITTRFVPASEVAQALQEAPLQILISHDHPTHAQELLNPSTVFDSYPTYLHPLYYSVYCYFQILLKKTYMPQIKSQALGQSRRIVLEAGSETEWQSLSAVFGKDPNAPDETVKPV